MKKRINEEKIANFLKEIIYFILFQSGVLLKENGVCIKIYIRYFNEMNT